MNVTAMNLKGRTTGAVKFWLWLPAIVMAMAAPFATQAADAAAGEKVFKKCAACHAVGENAKNKVGPVLNGVVGAAAGKHEGYKYSKAMLESGITWDEATLMAYLRAPNAVVKGGKMVFVGLKKDDEIVDVIAYLKGFGPDGKRR